MARDATRAGRSWEAAGVPTSWHREFGSRIHSRQGTSALPCVEGAGGRLGRLLAEKGWCGAAERCVWARPQTGPHGRGGCYQVQPVPQVLDTVEFGAAAARFFTYVKVLPDLLVVSSV